MGKAATQKAEEQLDDSRESTLSSLKITAKSESANNDPFHGNSGITNPFQDEDTLINLQLINKLLLYTPHPIIVSGVTGSGKSTFLRLFVRQYHDATLEKDDNIGDAWQIISFKATSRSKPNRLIKQICSSLNLERAKTNQALCQLINQQRISERQRPIPLLIIDNAHLLSEASLQLIADIAEQCTSKIHIILGSLPEFQNQFNHAKSRIRIGLNAHVLNIRPLTLQQTGEYLNRRIQAAGMDIPFTLTDVQIVRIHKQSAGIPGAINKAAQQVCRSHKSSAQIGHFSSNSSPAIWQKLKDFSSSIRPSRIGLLPILGVFVAGIAIGIFMQRESIMQLWQSDSPIPDSAIASNNTGSILLKADNKTSSSDSDKANKSSTANNKNNVNKLKTNAATKIANTKITDTKIAATKIAETQPASTTPAKANASDKRLVQQTNSDNKLANNSSGIQKIVVSKPTRLAEATVSKKLRPTQIANIAIVNTTKSTVTKTKSLTNDSAGTTKTSTLTVGTKTPIANSTAIDEKTKLMISKTQANKLKREFVAKLVKVLPQAPTPQSKKQSWNVPFANYLVGNEFEGKKWILKQNPRRYTIQLLSAKRWETVEQYQKLHQFDSGLASYQIRVKGNDWHVLVYGNFSSRKKALDKIRKFPEALRNNRFRIRKMRYVQREAKRGKIIPRKKRASTRRKQEIPVAIPTVTYPNPALLP
ncbi:hypothetical protein MNBD_GAMMA12-3395 [hydrothermal vent metagenome]|uniref:SPOR domain-containing protein n=1 Tax=hydrothermal vent metagenome TaxID=652676 RepID=A0A3B0Y270_9ZZZZ